MELTGFKRQARKVAVGAAAFGMAVTGLAVTTPAAVAQETSASSWTMPALREEILQDAVDSVLGEAGSENVRFNIYDATHNQVVYNYTNWVVCSQSPRAEATVKIGAKPQTVTLALQRRSAGC